MLQGGAGLQSPVAVTFLKTRKSITAGHCCFKPRTRYVDILGCECCGAKERASGHAWRGQMPRGMGPSSAVIINISSSWSHASDPGTAAAPARTVQLTRINNTFSLRYQLPCNFLCPCGPRFFTDTQRHSTKFLCASSNLHELHTRNKQATNTARIREM